jgi:hypothetical protein
LSAVKKFFFIGFLSFFVVLFFGGALGCQTGPIPLDEFSIARAALEAARDVQAPRLSPGFWHQAEEAYRKGKLLYKDSRWDEARTEFLKAKQAAEKAENSARLTRQRTGDIL